MRGEAASGKLWVLDLEDNVLHFDLPVWGGGANGTPSDAWKVIFIRQRPYQPPSHTPVTLAALDSPGWMFWKLPSTHPASGEAVMNEGPSVRDQIARTSAAHGRLAQMTRESFSMSCIAPPPHLFFPLLRKRTRAMLFCFVKQNYKPSGPSTFIIGLFKKIRGKTGEQKAVLSVVESPRD